MTAISWKYLPRFTSLTAAMLVALLSLASCGKDTQLPFDPSGPVLALGQDTATGASIETDQDDYLPGQIVQLVMQGWAADEVVHMEMTSTLSEGVLVSIDLNMDADGTWSGDFYEVQETDRGATFTLTGTGPVSGSHVVVIFTDGSEGDVTNVTVTPVAVVGGFKLSVQVDGSIGKNQLWNTTAFMIQATQPDNGSAFGTCVDKSPNVAGPTGSPPPPPNTGSHTFEIPGPFAAGASGNVWIRIRRNDCGASTPSTPSSDGQWDDTNGTFNIPSAPPTPAATTTALTRSPDADTQYGDLITFIGTVTKSSDNSVVGEGKVLFKYATTVGATCASGATAFAGQNGGTGIDVDASTGVAQYAIDSLVPNTYYVLACYQGTSNYAASTGGPLTHVVSPATTTSTISVSPTTQQYSDSVVFTATVSPARILASDLTGSVQFKIDGTDVGSPVAVVCTYTTPPNNCTATLTYQIVSAAPGPVVGTAVFTSTNANFGGSNTTTSADVTVTRENAQVFELQFSPSQILKNGTATISFKVRELNDDAESLAGAGNIDLAQVKLELTGTLNSSNKPVCNLTPANNGLTGWARVRSFSCTVSFAEGDTYDALVTVDGGHYTGAGNTVIQVTDPSAGFATGGGWYEMPDGDRVNFGFMAKATENRRKVVFQGAFLLIRHDAQTGDLIRVKGNVFNGYSISGNEVTFTGKANCSVISAGVLTNYGNGDFTGFARDEAEPGANVDDFGLYYPQGEAVCDALATSATLAGLTASAKTILGGNVQVPQPQGKKP